jgi:parallel beta-helix repeat protein
VLATADSIAAQPGATLKLPASPAATKSPCDNEPEEQDLFMVCTAGKVSVSGLTLDGAWPGVTCNNNLYALNAGGGVKLTLTGSKVEAAGAVPANGCQGGVGVQIGRNHTGQVATAKLTNDTIEHFQKNGVTIDGPGSSARVESSTITSEPTNQIATNGIQVSRNATARIAGVHIEGNECNVASCGANSKGFGSPSVEEWEEAEDATGILFYEAAGGSSVKNSTINGNDIGIYNLLNSASAKTTLSGNTLKGNRYWGIALDEGSAKINNNVLSGPGKAGIQIVQYAQHEQFHEPSRGQATGASGTGKSDAVSGMECALEGLSDNAPGDQPASLALKTSVSKFSGNTQELCNNTTTGTLVMSIS